jgi:uncharacterized membrane protein
LNFAYLHLLLNHFPVIGTIVGLGLFLLGLFEKHHPMRRAALILFAVLAFVTIPVFISGVGAQVALRKTGVSNALVQRHEGAAMLALTFMEMTGAAAVVGLWELYRMARPARWNIAAVLLLSVVTVGLMARTGNTGGDLRHPEIGGLQQPTGVEGTLGALVHTIEPEPDMISNLMVFTKWTTAFLMNLHFIGLVLIVGTIGIYNIRILGIAKHMPVAPLHRLLAWGLLGLGINVATGLAVFVGAPEDYTFNAVLWLKIVALGLLGLNAAAFYLTGIFNHVERLGPWEEAPMSAKVVALTSLVLWCAVITFGRYIQVFQHSIPRVSN